MLRLLSLLMLDGLRPGKRDIFLTLVPLPTSIWMTCVPLPTGANILSP